MYWTFLGPRWPSITCPDTVLLIERKERWLASQGVSQRQWVEHVPDMIKVGESLNHYWRDTASQKKQQLAEHGAEQVLTWDDYRIALLNLTPEGVQQTQAEQSWGSLRQRSRRDGQPESVGMFAARVLRMASQLQQQASAVEVRRKFYAGLYESIQAGLRTRASVMGVGVPIAWEWSMLLQHATQVADENARAMADVPAVGMRYPRPQPRHQSAAQPHHPPPQLPFPAGSPKRPRSGLPQHSFAAVIVPPPVQAMPLPPVRGGRGRVVRGRGRYRVPFSNVEGVAGPGDRPCYVCGELGHWARDCPNRAVSSDANAFALLATGVPICVGAPESLAALHST